jgi:RNA polymerase sigma-70 factor (ECF subfamily)
MEPPELEEWLKALHAESFSWALTCCRGEASDAEDVLQTVYLHILAGKARYRGQSEFRTWLFTVIRNQAAKEARRQIVRRLFLQRRAQEEASAPRVRPSHPAPDALLQNAERERAFEAALHALPRRQREVLHLVFYEDLTIDAAARVMGVSPGSARQHYERGKARLRREFQESN